MPDTDIPNTIVIGTKTGHSRTTNSWVLGRLLRDLNSEYDRNMQQERAHQPPGPTPDTKEASADTSLPRDDGKKNWEALRITVYQFKNPDDVVHGVPSLDRVWYSGVAVIIIELCISIIPWIINDDWAPFLITAAGNFLALVGGSLPQWTEEKWACPKKGGDSVTITQGNGSRNAIHIRGQKGVGLDLEILAMGTRTFRPSTLTKMMSIILACLWICLLIAVSGLENNTWCKLIAFSSPQKIHLIGSLY